MGWLKQSGPQGVEHTCKVPAKSRWVARDGLPPAEEFLVAAGDAWQCDECGAVWFVALLMGIPYWRLTTSRQRKRLLEGK